MEGEKKKDESIEELIERKAEEIAERQIKRRENTGGEETVESVSEKVSQSLNQKKNNLPRRKFLKMLGLSAGGLTLSSLTSADLFKITDTSNTSTINAEEVDDLELIADTLSNRPSAGTSGRLFYATDGEGVYYDNGSSWVQISKAAPISLSSDVTLNTQTVKITVYEDTDGDGTAENAETVDIGDGSNTYTLSNLDGSSGNTVWLHIYMDTSSVTSAPTVTSSGTDPGKTYDTSSEWNSAQKETGIAHESVSNTDHGNAAVIQKGPGYGGDLHKLNDPSQGLVGWWPLHKSTGTASDLSGNGNNGTVTGTTQVAGLRGLPARNFDGTDDYVNIGTSFGDNIFPAGSDFTISVWAKKDNTNSSQYIADYANSIVSIGYERVGSNGFEAHIYDGAHTNITSGNTSTDAWQHHVLTYKAGGNTMEYFINASSQGTGSVGTPSENRESFAFGASGNLGRDFFGGAVYGGRVYNRALSSSEIQTLYEWGGGG